MGVCPICVDMQVRVLGEGYSLDDEEDMVVKEITKIWIYNGMVTAQLWPIHSVLILDVPQSTLQLAIEWR